ncbi:hypothetical protein SeLEV6574_g02989 [Synchytrium endobioticum]|nr:hypothetical protein SeLEV6574_g02989 [Synchytrium endobioticum]
MIATAVSSISAVLPSYASSQGYKIMSPPGNAISRSSMLANGRPFWSRLTTSTPPAHTINWSVGFERGYRNNVKYGALGPQIFKEDIHHHFEDNHWPTTSEQQRVEGSEGATKFWILADGHGGEAAARFFVARSVELVKALIREGEWNFDLVGSRERFRISIENMYQSMDIEFCDSKVAEYSAWRRAGSDMRLRPIDDGCTLQLILLHKTYFVVANVGDTRTVIATRAASLRPSVTRGGNWSVMFGTEDHDMTHPERVHFIHSAGGEFVDQTGRTFPIQIDPPSVRGGRPYTELAGGRVYRPPVASNDAVKSLGVSYRRTLNMTASLGDLLFKLDPPVLSNNPDVSFIKLEPKNDYILIAATDGVWDHMREQGPLQNETAVDWVGSQIDGVRNPEDRSDLPDSSSLQSRINQAARDLASREREGGEDLYHQQMVRYDDCTAIIINVKAKLS